MKQSDARVPGRGGPPASFGRQAEEPEDFTVRGGESIHLVIHADVTPSLESLNALREAVREATRLGTLEGYAAAVDEMDAVAGEDGGG